VSEFGHGSIVDGLEHAPGSVLESSVAGNTIEDEDGFDGFRTVNVVSDARGMLVGYVP
jgi:photosystem II stability/assembly factor-like uncharacterized protein